VHLSGDVTESDGLPRRRAFSLSHGSMSGTAPRSVVPCESPLVLKSSSVSSVASKHVEDSVHCDGTGQSVFGKLLSMPSISHEEAVDYSYAVPSNLEMVLA